jgi:hypothetical protein
LIALVVAIAAAVCLGVFGSFGSASAAAPASTTPYPPSTCPLLTISTTTPFPGQTITIAGTNFTAGVAVTIELDTNVTLGHATADSSGSFSIPVTLPSNLTGNHLIRAVGTGLGNCPVDPIQIFASGAGPSSAGNGGGLASTGVDILTGVAIALALLALGAFLTGSGKRRSSSGHHSG